MISFNQWLNNWRYFCRLCERFEVCIHFVDDAVDITGKLINGNTYSIEFCDILMSTSAEFENVTKQICKEINPNFNDKSNIKALTKTITNKFPKIGETIINSPVQSFSPLRDWAESDEGTIKGIDWWGDHTDIKHQRYPNFHKASFQNCYNALASLFVMELYASTFVTDGEPVLQISSSPCSYFSSEYYFDLIWPIPKKLPDFEEKNKHKEEL